MKPIVTSVEELYNSVEGTGEVILDEMAGILRTTRIIEVRDMALLMDVSAHALNMAVRLLTGMTVRTIINRWRLLQARDMLRKKGAEEGSDGSTVNKAAIDRVRRLDSVARACGWRNYRVLLKVARRYRFLLE